MFSTEVARGPQTELPPKLDWNIFRFDLLALLCVMFLVFLSLSHMVSRVRCGT